MAVDRTSNSTHTVNTSTDSDLLVVNGVITYANGTVFYDIGSNVENLAVFGNTSINTIVANNSLGMQGQVLTTNGPDTGIYWSTVSAGNTTVMTAGDGLYQNATHYYVNANTGIIANSVGTFVDASYIANIAANSATYIGNSIASASYTNITNWISGNAATAYTNAATLAGTAYTNATSYADTKAGTAYSNATAYADTKAGTAYSNGTAYADSKASIAYSNAITYSIADATARAATAYANAVADAASDASTKAATAYSNAVSNAAALYAPLAGATFTGAISAPNVTTTSNTLTIGSAAYHVANGNLGIGTASPASKLAVSGTMSAGNTSLSGSLSLSDRINQTGTVTSSAGYIQLGGQLTVGSNTQQNMFTMQSSVSLQGNGTLPSLYGLLFLPTMVISANNVTNLYAVFARVDTDATYTGTIGTYTAFIASTPSLLGSTPNNIYQFVAQNATATAGVIGFRSQITSGTGKWNLFAVGTANNYMAGGLGIGTTTLTQPLTVTGNAAISDTVFVTNAVNAASHTVGTAFIANSTGVTTTGFANVSANVYVGNATVYTYTNATSFSGTANNATNFGGLTLATVQGQITGNASTAYANAIATAATDASTKAGTAYTNAIATAATDASTKAGTAYSNAVADASTQAGTAYANAVANAAALYQTTAGLAANVLTLSANLATYLGNSATTGANVASWITGNSATAYTNATSYADTKAGTAYANAVANAAALYQTTAGLSANVLTLSANLATYLGNSATTGANVASWITGNASVAYTNATSYADTKAGNAYANAVANAAALYQTKAGLAANVLTLSANLATYLGNSATTGANVASWITGNAATAYTNATTFAANASNISNGTLAEPRLPYRMDQNVTSTSVVTFNNITLTGNLYVNGQITTVGANNLSITDNMIFLNNGVNATITNITGNGTYVVFTANNNYSAGWDVIVTGVNPTSYNGTYLNIFAVNTTSFTVANTNTATYVSGGSARGTTDVNPDIGFAAGYNDGTYHHTGFFRRAADNRWYVFNNYDPEPDASIYIDVTNTSFRVADLQSNTMYLGNTTVYGTVNSTIYTGAANAATYLGNNFGTIANVASWITGNASVAYTNATSYAATIAGTAYTNAVATASTDATNKAANAYSNAIATASTDATQKAGNAYSNAVTAAATAAAGIYQTTAGLAANVLTLTSNNSTNFGGYTWASPGALGTTTANSGNFTAVNAASHTVGSNFIANTTGIQTTGFILANGTFTTVATTGKVILGLDSGGSISMGRTDGVASAPYIDFNSGATAIDYDARIAASAGNGTVGAATVTISSGALTATSNTLTIGTAAYVIASGNVGIGTSTPSNKLHVAGNGFFTGNFGIGSSVSATATLALSKTITGGVTAYGILQNGSVQSDVTTAPRGIYNILNVINNTTFTMNQYTNYGTQATRPAILNATLNNLYGYLADSTLVAGISNYGFLSQIPLSSVSTISNVALTTNVVTITTSAAHVFWPGQTVIVAATTTTSINGSFTVLTCPSTTTFTYALVLGDIASVADSGSATVSTGRWNMYSGGTAPNYFNGQIAHGTFTLTNGYLSIAPTQAVATSQLFVGGTNQSTNISPTGLSVSGTLIGTSAMTSVYGIVANPVGSLAAGATVGTFGGIYSNPVLNSATTPTSCWGVVSQVRLNAAASGGTITNVAGYAALNPSFNAAATTDITTYSGFRASTAASGAGQTITNIYAFEGLQDIAASSNAYNLFMSGTAPNYLAGNTGIGNTLPDATLAVTGTANISGAVTLGSTLAAGNTTFTGQVTINAGANNLLLTNGTSNWIYWETSGTDAPAFTTRSVGTKLVLYPAIGASAVDYALGINAGTLWSSIPGNDAGQFFKWYGGQTEVASLSGTGNFLIGGSVNADSYTVGSNFVANSIGITTTGFASITGNTSTNNMAVATKLNVGTAAGYNFGTLAVIEIDSSQNTYVQTVIQNANSGVNASADLVLTNDTGNDSVNYINFGINSSTYSNSLYSIGAAGDGYLYASNGALGIGTASAKDIIFHANGTLSTDEKMRIAANGNIGIGTSTPGNILNLARNQAALTQMTVYNANTTVGGQSAILLQAGTGNGLQIGQNYNNTAFIYTNDAAPITISTSATERMRITATGNTGIGNTAPNATLAVTGTANISGAVSIGGTLTVPLINVIDASGVANATFISAVKNGAYFLNSQARAPAGAYNNLVTVNDSIMVYSNGTVGYGALSIIPWAGSSGGIRLATSANSTTIGLTGNTTLTGTFTHDSATGNYGSSTAAATYQLGYGATTTGVLKTINLGTGGAAGSTTNVNIGSTLSNTFVTINANTATVTGAITLTRINPRIGTVANTATITPTADASDQYNVTALGVAATIAIPSGTAVDGQKLTIRIKDNGTARALTWTTSAGGYRVVGTTLPTTTVISKTVYVGCIYNSADTFWDVIAVAQQA